MRKFIAYGEPAGSAVMITEVDDGATIAVAQRDKSAEVNLDATALMKLTREMASLFGHLVVHETEWHDKLVSIVDKICERNGARCLDDYTDRQVVIREIVGALVAAALPKARA